MNPPRAIYAVVLFAGMITACVTNEASQVADESSQVRSDDTATIDSVGYELDAVPRACTIAAFCGPPRFCVRTGPCTNGQALQLALTFCLKHCTASNCNNIMHLGQC